jgi:hypothetical protein
MSPIASMIVRTTAIALALVLLGWFLGVLLPAEQVTDASTGGFGGLLLPLTSAFLLAAGLAYPISRSRLDGRALFGVVFLAVFGLTTVLTLVDAGLIPPNPFMPDYVRYAHMLEIGWSNFVLGLLIGFLFWNPPLIAAEATRTQEEAA